MEMQAFGGAGLDWRGATAPASGGQSSLETRPISIARGRNVHRESSAEAWVCILVQDIVARLHDALPCSP